MTPLYPVLRRTAPRYATWSVQLGQAMIQTVRGGASRRVPVMAHINEFAAP
ncbi:hypothetical protein ABZ876_12945 [Streptomyces sp. NPDC046931]|uniref:hypothetical protein n=1 Tax=Streptomyces sp. NPDC046931 TaxID=3154806 RepID=UPI0033CC04ED